MTSWKKPTDEMIDKALASVKKETDRQYFFSRLKNPLWIQPLKDRGYFQLPPGVKHLPDGSIQFPFWPEFSYLVQVFDSEPEKVLGILERLPDTDNPWILKGIIDVVLKADPPEVIHRFKSKIMAFVDNAWVYPWMGHDNIIELLKKPYLFEKPLEDFTSSLLSKVVEFRPDSQSEDKQTRRRKGQENLMTLLKPGPRFGRSIYQKILKNGVRSLAEKEPYRVARILIKRVAVMIPLTMHQEDIDKGKEEDISEAWCQRLDAADHDYEDSRATLVRTLTFACGKVYQQSSESVSDLDEVLRNQRWKVFKRLRQHLYALYPNEQTRPWIRELILKHGDYARWEHHYEFQRMIRSACEHFGVELLTEEERTQIFDAIRSGPSETDFREWVGEQFTEDRFRQRERRFHRMQFNPFVSVLFGEHATYFQELETEAKNPISDEDYSLVGEIEGGVMSERSPKSGEALAKLTDEKLLTYINKWQEEYHDKDNWLVKITIESLAKEFQSVFRDSIIPDTDRLRFWMENRERIERPIYVCAMVEAMQERVKAKDFDKLNEWLPFCEWVLSHPDQEHEEGYRRGDASRENPCWRNSRRAVGDFVETCLKNDVDVPITTRDPLAKLLEMLCTQFDWRLDRNNPIVLNRDDQLAEAINNTRSRAMESLVHFGSWLRRHDQREDISTITTILEKRFSSETDYPLSLPEYAILGSRYGNVFSLNKTWAIEHKSHFFPQDKLRAWSEVFKNFLRFHRPFKPTFEVLRDDFDFALEHLQSLRDKEHPINSVDTLGQHLFVYYLWEAYPLTGEKSLLERYYRKTHDDQVRRTNLFGHVGRMLQNSEKHLDHALKERCMQFFDWRFEVGDPTELREFTPWLDAQCLDAGWRLDAYSEILDICISGKVKPFHDILRFKPMVGMLNDHTAKVVECFAKLTGCAFEHDTYFLEADEAKTILKAGLESNDENVRNNAERARENLIRHGRFDFLDV